MSENFDQVQYYQTSPELVLARQELIEVMDDYLIPPEGDTVEGIDRLAGLVVYHCLQIVDPLARLQYVSNIIDMTYSLGEPGTNPFPVFYAERAAASSTPMTENVDDLVSDLRAECILATKV